MGHCVGENRDLRDLSLEELKEFHAAFPASGAELLDLERSIESRRLFGGTARETVNAALEVARQDIAQQAEALDGAQT